ncbi:hypothetical protein ACJWSE_27320, partial [Klebsiella pneumoniae]|nr:hypothetical protein [Klebsiella pneumoniae]
KRAYCLKTQPATGETYPKSDLFNKAQEIQNAAGSFLPVWVQHTVVAHIFTQSCPSFLLKKQA